MKETYSHKIQHAKNSHYANKDALVDAENNMPEYNKSIVAKFAKYFGIDSEGIEQDFRVLEFGAGGGALSDLFRGTFSFSAECVEIDPYLVKILKEKKYITHKQTPQIQNQYDFVYTSNVLEHIDDDVSALIQLRKTLKPKGKIAIYVPALPFLFSNLDLNAGHIRRYKRKELVDRVEAAGFLVDRCFYSDCLGVPASLALKIFGYGNKFNLGFGKSLIIYDRIIYPVSKLIDSIGFKYLLGKNLFLFARIPSYSDSLANKASVDLNKGSRQSNRKRHVKLKKKDRL